MIIERRDPAPWVFKMLRLLHRDDGVDRNRRAVACDPGDPSSKREHTVSRGPGDHISAVQTHRLLPLYPAEGLATYIEPQDQKRCHGIILIFPPFLVRFTPTPSLPWNGEVREEVRRSLSDFVSDQ